MMNEIYIKILEGFGLIGIISIISLFLLQKTLSKKLLSKLSRNQLYSLILIGLIIFTLSIMSRIYFIEDEKLNCSGRVEYLKNDYYDLVEKFERDKNVKKLEDSVNDNFHLTTKVIKECSLDWEEKQIILNHKDSLLNLLQLINSLK